MKGEIKLPEGYELKELETGLYEVVKTFEFEVGKDYVNINNRSIVIDWKDKGYDCGFSNIGFDTELYCSDPNAWREATETEVIQVFEKELIRRYGEDWEDVKVKECVSNCQMLNSGDKTVVIHKTVLGWRVWNKNACLYYKGKWAEKIEEFKDDDWVIPYEGLELRQKLIKMDQIGLIKYYKVKSIYSNFYKIDLNQPLQPQLAKFLKL